MLQEVQNDNILQAITLYKTQLWYVLVEYGKKNSRFKLNCLSGLENAAANTITDH